MTIGEFPPRHEKSWLQVDRAELCFALGLYVSFITPGAWSPLSRTLAELVKEGDKLVSPPPRVSSSFFPPGCFAPLERQT